MDTRKYSWLLISTSLCVSSCAPPPIVPANATLAIETKDDGGAIGTTFSSVARRHGMTVAEVEIPGVPGEVPPVRRRDAMGRDMQVHSANASSPHITVVHFYRGGLTFRIAPARESKILEVARDFCISISDDPSVISVRSAKGSRMLGEMPAETGCAFADNLVEAGSGAPP